MKKIRVLSWNVRWQGFGTRASSVLQAVHDDGADIVTLQEVPLSAYAEVAAALGDAGLVHHVWSHDNSRGDGKVAKHGELIAARHPVKQDRGWVKAATYPELFARALVEWPGIEPGIDVITAHIPNGSYNGWVKVEHLQRLGVALQTAPDAPRVLTGDFNEPREFRSSGQIVSWGAEPKKDGALSVGGVVTKGTFEPRPRVDWGRAVRDVLSRSSHGLTNVIEARRGLVPTPVTHLVGGEHPRGFDHGFASRHFEVVDSGYHHEWREREWSDHSALWFTLRPRDVGELVEWS